MDKVKAGFIWTLETIKDGKVIETEKVANLVPIEGLNYLISTGFKQGAAYPTFYIGLFEGDYTPIPADTAATFPGDATELTAYVSATRPALTLGTVDAGAADNSAAKAEFTGNVADKQAMGGFISSSPTKGSTTGILVSVVRFPSPKPLGAGSILRVTAAFSFISI